MDSNERAKIQRELERRFREITVLSWISSPRINGTTLTQHFREAPISQADIDRFIHRCEQYSEQYSDRTLEDVPCGDLEDMLRDLFNRLDELFFFGLLSRRFLYQETNISIPVEIPLWRLRLGENHPEHMAATKDSSIYGNWIEFYVLDSEGRFNQPYSGWHMLRNSVWALFMVLAHEMCHAYLVTYSSGAAYDHDECFRQMEHFIWFKLAAQSDVPGVAAVLQLVCDTQSTRSYSIYDDFASTFASTLASQRKVSKAED
ncbi:hypothetical protein F5Y18DRAFT_322495 [Xylariaceae sp. FL1019]|nr:hypothetical protein F5Y18DRAFT_322495 [Xylariaceae sp. FL1019]